mgnify:CR=1 FL=1
MGDQSLYHEPLPSEVDNYEQRADGCWYPKDAIEFEEIEINDGPRTPENEYIKCESVTPANLPEDGQGLVGPNDWSIVYADPANGISMGIGDVTSDEKGTGARFNVGKPPMHFIPIRQQLLVYADYRLDPQYDYLFDLLLKLARFEMRECSISDIVKDLEITDLHAAAFVWEYGAKKYAPFNWAKGMPWSVPLGCIARHAQAILMGEELDQESGCEHWGHIVCNVLMLEHYSRFFREGDDRPPRKVFSADL